MKLDDIINKAVADDVLADWREYGIVGRGLTLNHEPTERLIAAFDPEHVALMEDVCEAAADWFIRPVSERVAPLSIEDALAALWKYRRKEADE